MLPVVSADRMASAGSLANTERTGARATEPSWQVMQYRVYNSLPSSLPACPAPRPSTPAATQINVNPQTIADSLMLVLPFTGARPVRRDETTRNAVPARAGFRRTDTRPRPITGW